MSGVLAIAGYRTVEGYCCSRCAVALIYANNFLCEWCCRCYIASFCSSAAVPASRLLFRLDGCPDGELRVVTTMALLVRISATLPTCFNRFACESRGTEVAFLTRGPCVCWLESVGFLVDHVC